MITNPIRDYIKLAEDLSDNAHGAYPMLSSLHGVSVHQPQAFDEVAAWQDILATWEHILAMPGNDPQTHAKAMAGAERAHAMLDRLETRA